MGKTLVWFSFNRSGTNHLADLLAAIPGVASMMEVFEPSSVQVHSFQDDVATVMRRLIGLCDAFGIAPVPCTGNGDLTAQMKNPALVAAVHADPLRALRVLDRLNGAPLNSIKIFPDHLAPGQVARLIADPDVIPCLYLRNPLDTYISMLKRREAGQFRGVDTTALRPRVGVRGYVAYLEKRARWLTELGAHSDRFAIRLRYEDLVGLGSEAAKIAWLQRRLGNVVVLPGGDPKPIRVSPIQDSSRTPDMKIANHRNLVRRLAELGLAPDRDLCDWPAMDAVGHPAGN